MILGEAITTAVVPVSNIKFAWIHAKVSWDQLESDPWIGETNLGSLFGDANLS